MYKIFPKTEAYLIFYDPGAGGNFVRNLIANLYYKNEFGNSNVGMAHSIEYPINITKESLEKHIDYTNTGRNTGELTLDPEDESLPVIFNSHSPNYNYVPFFKKFPQGKILFITTDLCDIPRLSVNQFFKVIDFFYDYGTAQHQTQKRISWAFCKKRFPFLITKRSPKDCSVEDLSSIFMQCHSKSLLTENFNDEFITNLPLNKNKYLNIPYRKLIKDSGWVLDQLSIFTNKPLNENSKKNYENYLNAQTNLLNKYAPWILSDPSFT